MGDDYPQITFDFFQYLEEGGDSTKYTDKKYYNATIKYITPTGGLILEATDIEDMKIARSLIWPSRKLIRPSHTSSKPKRRC